MLQLVVREEQCCMLLSLVFGLEGPSFRESQEGGRRDRRRDRRRDGRRMDGGLGEDGGRMEVVSYEGSYESSFCWPLTCWSSSTETHWHTNRGQRLFTHTQSNFKHPPHPNTSVNLLKLSEIRAECFPRPRRFEWFVCFGAFRSSNSFTSYKRPQKLSLPLFFSFPIQAERICLWDTFEWIAWRGFKTAFNILLNHWRTESHSRIHFNKYTNTEGDFPKYVNKYTN